MEGTLFLVGSILFGIGLIRRILTFGSATEKLFWGITTGLLVSTWSAYIVSRLSYEISYTSLIILTVVMWLFAVYFLRDAVAVVRRWKVLDGLRENAFLILLLLAIVPVFLYFFYTGMFRMENGGMQLTVTSWYDMALHLAIANSFVYGQNFPPMYMVMPGEPLRYPFLPDFHAAIFLKFGWSIWASFAVTASVAAVALIGTFYCFARRLSNSGAAAFIAGLLFFFNGGLGFLFFFRDWYVGDRSLIAHLLDPKENYTDMYWQGIKWVSLIPSGMVPQRAMLFGMPVAFLVLSLFAKFWRDRSEAAREERWDGSRILLIAGIFTGLLPLFHAHSYMAIGLISGFLFLLRPRISWIVFWLPAVVLALPQILGGGGRSTMDEFMTIQPGWMSHIPVNFVSFIVLSFGVPLAVVIPALFYVDRTLRTFYFAFAAVMVFCFIFKVSPNDFDNIKLLYYWHAATAVVIAVWLSGIVAVRPKLRILVAAIVLASTASGILATIRESKLELRVFSPEEIEAGTFARDKTEPHATFLTGQYHNQPAMCLGGRKVFLGYEFWITSHGYGLPVYQELSSKVRQMYLGGPNAERLLNEANIGYVYIGPSERREFNANETYFNANHDLVFKNKDISIYKLNVY